MYVDDILKMPAGQDMDDQVAAEVFGKSIRLAKTYIQNSIKPRHARSYGKRLIIEHTDERGVSIPRYSTDISAAWLVFEQITKNKPAQNDPEPTIIQIWRGINEWHIAEIWLHHDGDIQIWTVSAETAPLAICRAALMSITVMRENVL